MKHTEQWETCDQCGKDLSTTGGVLHSPEFYHSEAVVMRASKHRRAHGKFCSRECVGKWLTEATKIIYGDYDEIIDESVDDLTTDQWGGAGPDCCTVPV